MSDNEIYERGVYHGYHGSDSFNDGQTNGMSQAQQEVFRQGYREGGRRMQEGWKSPHSPNG